MAGAVRVLVRIRADAVATPSPDGRVVLEEGHMRMAFGPLGPGLTAAVAALGGAGTDETALATAVREAEDEQAILKLHMLLRRLEFAGWLERVVLDEAGEALATLRPLGHQLPAPPRPLAPGAEAVLSRFAALQAVGGELVAESPRAPFSLAVHSPALAALLGSLAQPADPATWTDQAGLSAEAARAALPLAVRARIVVAVDEEEQAPLAYWNRADLLFHTRSRVGSNVGGYGGTYHLRDRVEPLPAVKPVTGATIALERPDLAALGEEDVPLSQVLEARRSVRVHDDAHPITATALGHFLFRSARLRSVFFDGQQELSDRPYPGGGAVYELELYPLVTRCDGIAPALYRYDPSGHALEHVADPGPKLALLAQYGQRTAVMDAPPQVLILIAARFGRAMWKYESMAYALVLKHVGVMYQTMYLVATSMGLAPCSLGGGHSEAFADAAGLDPYDETSVGEFILGSRAD